MKTRHLSPRVAVLPQAVVTSFVAAAFSCQAFAEEAAKTQSPAESFNGWMAGAGFLGFVVAFFLLVLAVFWLLMPMLIWSQLGAILRELRKQNKR